MTQPQWLELTAPMAAPKKLIVLTAETNGPFGQVFAIGAVCLPWQAPDSIDDIHEFAGRCATGEPAKPWIASTIMPLLGDIPPYSSPRLLRNAFWHWLQENKDDALIVADDAAFGIATLLAACQKDEPSREWRHNQMIHELSTLLYAAGIDPNLNREQIANSRMISGQPHNPLHDVYVIATVFRKAWTLINNKHLIVRRGLEMLDSVGIWTGFDDVLEDRLSQLIDEYKHLREKAGQS